MTDDSLVAAAADAAHHANAGRQPSVESLLKAIASTRSAARRSELHLQAQQRAQQLTGTLTEVGLEVLRLVFLIAL